MPVQKLAKAGALGAGSDLWIIPPAEFSPWARKIDWYLNFQVARATAHASRPRPSQIEQILSDNEIDLDFEFSKGAALMVVTSQRIPVEQLISLPFKDDVNSWIKAAQEIWERLNRPRLRLFLPINTNESAVNSAWPEDDTRAEVSFVPGDVTVDA